MKRKSLLLLLLLLTGLFAGCRPPEPTIQNAWVEENGKTYYRDEAGNLVTGWQTIDGQQYYFAEDHTFLTGWQTLNGVRHYFREDGTQVLGWQDIDEKRYYFTAGGAVSGWQGIDGQQYYFLEDFSLATGVIIIDGMPHLFSEAGSLCGGVAPVDGVDRLFLESGTLASGWCDYMDKRYFINEDGTFYSGWLEDGENRYYLQADGSIAIGKQEIDGRTYYFSPHGVEVILVNPWNYMSEDYVVNQVPIDSYYTIDERCYDDLMRMLADCKAAGHGPMVVSGYRSWDIQEFLFQRKVNYYVEEMEITDLAEARRLASMTIAIPGTSEHQLGLAVDIASTEYRELDEGQVNTATQQWLMQHCWEYGFILRYPLGTTDITGIVYEPWHYRYVGVEISMELRDLGITLEEYLGAV